MEPNAELSHADLRKPEIPAKRPKRIPVVLTREEVRRLLNCMRGEERLMARLLYGSGLRLMECLRLRVQDVDMERRQITVRDGKGGKDRITMLAEGVVSELSAHLEGCGGIMRARTMIFGRYIRLRRGYGATRELMGHADVSTTQIYTHVLSKPGMGVRSPLDL